MTKAQLNLYITYSGDDANNDVINDILQALAEHAADRGLLTLDYNLIVEESTYEIFIAQEK